jgi:CBS domain-containing protein
MTPTTKPLLNLTAADLMSPTLVAVPEAMSLRGAARLLSQTHVTGAPVVDAEGRCVGVISSTDFVRWAEKGRRAGRPRNLAAEAVCEGQILDPAELPEERVTQFMTRDPVSAPVSASVGELARMMLDAHIHRVIVADADGKPVGIVSSTDVLAAVAHADAARAAAAERAGVKEPCPC